MRPGGTIVNKSNQNPKNQFQLGISELTIENNSSSFIGQATLPKKGHQIDSYQGPVDPVTRLRHGKGVYRYPNKFFTFQGNYSQGVKEGQGKLTLGDGTVIQGKFVNDQLIGQAEIRYADGSVYRGDLRYGQKCGYGSYKSKLESYQGEYSENKKHGAGTYQTRTTRITGTFKDDKAQGSDILIQRYNYEYRGECRAGLKSGKGMEKSTYIESNYTYEGGFSGDKFDGKGLYINNSQISYRYQGQFRQGAPVLYPNCFRVSVGQSTGSESQKPEALTLVTSQGAPIQYELELENQLWLTVESCYQAPQQLDPNQPSEEDIEKMVKDWQAENKKNKNPPPMPDFRQPRMIKPALVVVEQESLRPVVLRLSKGQGNQNAQNFKVDYRQAMAAKRKQNQQIKAENAKKMQQQTAKKGGKGPNKAAEVQLKVNCFSQNPKPEQTQLTVYNQKGRVSIDRLEFPDDFPPGNYSLTLQSPFCQFGKVKQFKKTLIIKPKNVAGKKK